MKIAVIIGFLLCGLNLQAQKEYLIAGMVKDSASGKGLPGVGVAVKGSSFATATDSCGKFSVRLKRFPTVLLFSHVSYGKKEVVVKKAGDVSVSMENHMNILPEFPVTVEKPVDLMPGFPVYIWDYELFNDTLFAFLGFEKKSLTKPCLYLSDMKGNVVDYVSLPKKGRLMRDCTGVLFFVTPATASSISWSEKGIRLTTESASEDFEDMISACVDFNENRYYLRGLYANRQKLTYFLYDRELDSLKEINTIADAAGLRMLKDKPRLMGMQGYTEFSERFEQMCMYKPVFAPLIKRKDSLIIYDFVNEKVFIYDLEGRPLTEKVFDVPKKKELKGECYVDRMNDKTYVLFQKRGLTELAEIARTDNKILRMIPVPDLSFVEKIRVHNGILYFLYKDDSRSEYKKIFKMKIG